MIIFVLSFLFHLHNQQIIFNGSNLGNVQTPNYVLRDINNQYIYAYEGDQKDVSCCLNKGCCQLKWIPFIERNGSYNQILFQNGNQTQDNIGTIKRDQSSRFLNYTQYTYSNYPLYYYRDDRQGQSKGIQSFNGYYFRLINASLKSDQEGFLIGSNIKNRDNISCASDYKTGCKSQYLWMGIVLIIMMMIK